MRDMKARNLPGHRSNYCRSGYPMLRAALLGLFLVFASALSVPAASGGGTVRSTPVPVIVIPGIGGSELRADDGLLWPPFDASASANIKDFAGAMREVAGAVTRLNRLSLDLSCRTKEHVVALGSAAGRAEGSAPSSPMASFGVSGAYRALLDRLAESRGRENVYFFGYDWRLDNEETAVDLRRFIVGVQRDRGVSRVDIVAHSMGGLVLSGYLARYGAGAVRHVVLAGSPLAGAAEAEALIWGYKTSSASGGVEALLGAALLPSGVGEAARKEGTSIAQIYGGITSTVAALARGYPSAYELLPAGSLKKFRNDMFVDAVTPAGGLKGGASAGTSAGEPDDEPGRAKNPAAPAGQTRQSTLPCAGSPAAAASKARNFHTMVLSRLGAIYRGVDLHVMAGTGRKTLSAVMPAGSSTGSSACSPAGPSIGASAGRDDSPLYAVAVYEDGDGTVTRSSATAGGLFARRTSFFAVDHVNLVSDPACLAFIAAALGDK